MCSAAAAAADRSALAAVLLSTRRLRRDGDWIDVRAPPVRRHADRVMRAAARCVGSMTGVDVQLRCGGFQCAAGGGVAVCAFLSTAHASAALPRARSTRALRAVTTALAAPALAQTCEGWVVHPPTYIKMDEFLLAVTSP
jgi:hypothetical protein